MINRLIKPALIDTGNRNVFPSQGVILRDSGRSDVPLSLCSFVFTGAIKGGISGLSSRKETWGLTLKHTAGIIYPIWHGNTAGFPRDGLLGYLTVLSLLLLRPAPSRNGWMLFYLSVHIFFFRTVKNSQHYSCWWQRNLGEILDTVLEINCRVSIQTDEFCSHHVVDIHFLCTTFSPNRGCKTDSWDAVQLVPCETLIYCCSHWFLWMINSIIKGFMSN